MNDTTDLIASLDKEETDLTLLRFTNDDAWWLGSRLRDVAKERGYPIAIEVRRGPTTLFFATLEGATSDNAGWTARKLAVVSRFEQSSFAMALKLRDRGAGFDRFGLDPDHYVLAGGGVPIRVAGVGVVGGLAVSGLPDAEDHALAVAMLTELKAKG